MPINNVENYVPINPFTAEWALRALIDFTMSNARRFYSSMGIFLGRERVTNVKNVPINNVENYVHIKSKKYIGGPPIIKVHAQKDL